MAGRNKWADVRAQRDGQPNIEKRRAKAQADLELELAEYDATLNKLRRARGWTQAQLAKALGVSQAQVSRIESQSDLFLSTLRSYVEAIGGDLELVARFGDTAVPIELDELGETTGGSKVGKDPAFASYPYVVLANALLRGGAETAGSDDLMAALEQSIAEAKGSERESFLKGIQLSDTLITEAKDVGIDVGGPGEIAFAVTTKAKKSK